MSPRRRRPLRPHRREVLVRPQSRRQRRAHPLGLRHRIQTLQQGPLLQGQRRSAAGRPGRLGGGVDRTGAHERARSRTLPAERRNLTNAGLVECPVTPQADTTGNRALISHYYRDQMATDFGLCHPLVPELAIRATVAKAGDIVARQRGSSGPPPAVMLDLEQFQMVDYAAFDGVNDEQRSMLLTLHGNGPIRSDEMIYLALRSLVEPVFAPPASVSDLQWATAFELELNIGLRHLADKLSSRFNDAQALLPYWGRRSYLSVMGDFPIADAPQLQPGRVACALIKRPQFNATTFALNRSSLIGVNWALEPILKNFNRFLLHYFHTQESAGPSRISRAWRSIAPTVFFFWSDTDVREIFSGSSLLFDVHVAKLGQSLTADQVDFIVSHELGHVASNHGPRLQAARSQGADVSRMRHEFEFAADAFAYACRHAGENESASKQRQTTDDYLASVVTDHMPADPSIRLDATCLLFTYMDFVDQCGQVLSQRLGVRLPLRRKMDSHPAPRARLKKLETRFRNGAPHETALTRYTSDFLGSVLAHLSAMDDEAMLASLSSPT